MTPIPIEGPAVEPVTVAEMRGFLRLDDGAEDALVADLIRAAPAQGRGFGRARAPVEPLADRFSTAGPSAGS